MFETILLIERLVLDLLLLLLLAMVCIVFFLVVILIVFCYFFVSFFGPLKTAHLISSFI